MLETLEIDFQWNSNTLGHLTESPSKLDLKTYSVSRRWSTMFGVEWDEVAEGSDL